MSRGRAGAPPEEREWLLRSIEDLDREHAAGEIDEPEYRRLREGYVARAAALLREAERAPEPGDEAGAAAMAGGGGGARRGRLRRTLGRRRVRVVLGAGLAVCVAGLVVLFALRAAGVRLPGETASGGVALSSAQHEQLELQQARQLGSEGDLQGALSLYQAILAGDPAQPEALAYRGWLLRLIGLQVGSNPDGTELKAAGRASIERAIAVDPGYGDAHLFLGLSLLEDEQELLPAVAQFRLALADHASGSLVTATRPILVGAFRSAHAALPSALGPSPGR